MDLLNVQKFIWDNVENGSEVMTDEAQHYKRLEKWTLCKHSKVNHSKGQYVNGNTHTNSIGSVWSVLKRGINGTFHHISKKHLQRYLNEFTFRLSEGNVEIDTMNRINALMLNLKNGALTHAEIIR